jgi:hypothetical protein
METVNTQYLREALQQASGNKFGRPDDALTKMFYVYSDWMGNAMLTVAERQAGAGIYNDAIQGVR